MQDKFEQLKQFSSKVHLEPEKKAVMRQRIVSLMRAHEAMAIETASAPFSWAQKFVLPAGAFALLLLIGGGTSLAAENALPGDPLYAVKTKINEPLIASLAPSESAKAEWHATVALRRLEEADTLALQGKLTPEAKTEIGDNFATSADKAEATIASLDAKGDGDAETADDLSTKFESSLKAHAEILAKLDPGAGADASTTPPAMSARGFAAALPVQSAAVSDPLIAKIRSTIASIASKHGESEAKIANDGGANGAMHAAEGKIGAANNVIASVNDFLAKNTDTLGADAASAARARLDAVSALMNDASLKFSAKDYKAAFALASQALRKAQETRVLAEAQLKAQTTAAAEPQDAGTPAAPARAMNLLENNPQDDASTSDDNVIMNSVTITVTTTPTSNLNVDGKQETEHP